MNKEKNKETAGAGPADQTNKKLFKNAMKGDWDEVVKIYSDNPSIHKAKITRSGGTALHIAVSDGREEIVKELVNIIKASAQEVLWIEDEIGNTPLHTAAMLGNVKMCKCIAEVDKRLIGARNKDSETLFFMAASHGHKHAFLCLHSLCELGEGYAYSRRNDGETILHCAISGDYFGEGDDDSNSKFKAQGHQLFPPNYSVCFELVKLASKAILVILGLGSNIIRNIREKKQKNIWSIQVMNELLKRASMYENENDGKKPQQSPPQPENEVESETKPYVIDAGGDVTFFEDAFDKAQSPIPSTSNISGANQHQQIKAAKGPQEKNQTVQEIMQNVHNSSNPSTMNKEKNKETADQTKEKLETPEETKKRLFKNAMKSEWAEVVQIYRDNRWIHKAKITRSGGTALHIAVSDGREEIVEELVNIIKDSAQEVLWIGDEIGNTPLHTAAMLGNVKMCKCIAEVDKTLIGARNKDSDTPFFLAASHGHKHAFLCLHSLCEPGEGYDYSRRNNGETILHCAISRDYFGQSFQFLY
ncbi:hypothetical protein LWI29_032134 [Acer saccharum]|uniref:Uncharacterized protein n=1 Tax=Acer saccharum TaxID=4024 RepID=A0AA39S1S3_ACESA|nr:hypothetical protein LWI29_032134 [Acer saccharum]